MCREQLVKLRPHVKELEGEGAAVLAMSMDTPEQASRLAQDLYPARAKGQGVRTLVCPLRMA